MAAIANADTISRQTAEGAEIVVRPGEWVASNSAAAGTAASASKAAGAAGVRRVMTWYTVTLSATTALAGITTVVINFRDGAAGAGSVLFTVTITLPAAVLLPTTFSLSGLNIVGSAATAMTIEGSTNVGNLMESISFGGYDAK